MRCNLLYRQYLRLLPLLLALLLCGNPAQGQTKKQLERDKVKIEKEIARLNDELSKARKNSKNSTKQITLIKGRIQERTRLIDNINSQMALLDRQIGRTEDSLRMVRNQIDNMKAEYAQVVRTLYGLRQNISSTGLLFDNEQYNYSYLKMKYFAEYSRYRKHQETTIRRREQLFNDMSLDLQRQRKEKTSLLAQERKQRDALSREQQQQQKKLNKSQQDEKSLQQQISKKEKQRRELQRQIQQLINAEVAKNSGGGASSSSASSGTKNSSSTSGGNKTYNDAASSDFAQNRGRLPWPVYYKSVAREYGIYTHPSGGKNKNNGIDLNCAPGATVSAVFGGTVVKVDSFQGTKVVIVRHGAYMTVYAGLGTVSVSQGSKVATKQTLGTVYKGDEATSEFSFQVWCGGDALNPRHWLR
ncbi:MAG: peptidoglycan DD-metalloendopeptidase family protein [Bacteroidales bacterium]|nr:peptidoglycan DD-metalloendopeptidase family protein [Bacteroidales bacterium]